jgi:recombination protein RecA
MFQKGAYLDERGNELKRSAESPAGNYVMMHIAKTKACRPDRRVGFYTLKYGEGVDVVADTFETALKYGIIQQAGAWFTFIDLDTGEVITDENDEIIKIQGKPNVIQFLKETPTFFQEIYDKLSTLIEKP